MFNLVWVQAGHFVLFSLGIWSLCIQFDEGPMYLFRFFRYICSFNSVKSHFFYVTLSLCTTGKQETGTETCLPLA